MDDDVLEFVGYNIHGTATLLGHVHFHDTDHLRGIDKCLPRKSRYLILHSIVSGVAVCVFL